MKVLPGNIVSILEPGFSRHGPVAMLSDKQNLLPLGTNASRLVENVMNHVGVLQVKPSSN